jgi:hypothetical protein
LDFSLDNGSVHWKVVARVYDEELCLIETAYDLYEHAGADGVSDHLYDLVCAGDSRLVELGRLGGI